MTSDIDAHALVGRHVRDRRSGLNLGVVIGVAGNYSHTDLPVYRVKCDDRRTRRFYGDEIDVDQDTPATVPDTKPAAIATTP